MQYINIFSRSFVVLFFALIVSSCSTQEEYPTGEMPIIFTSQIESEEKMGISSRASDTSWTSNDRIGIYMVNSGSSLGTNNLANNIEYKADATGSNSSLSAVNSAICYPQSGKVRFVAYYPYQKDITTTYAVNVTNQSSLTSQAACDLLYHKDNIDYDQQSKSVALTFKHQLSKVVVNVTPDANVTSNLSDLNVKITNTPTKANFDLATAGLSPNTNSKADIVFYKTSSPTTGTVVRDAILVPHVGNDYTNRSIVLTLGTTIYTYPILASQDFETGNKYTYHLILSTSGISLQEVTITDWTGATTPSWEDTYSLTADKSLIEADYPNGIYSVVINTTSSHEPSYALSTTSSSVTGTVSWINNITRTKSTTSNGVTIYTFTFTVANNISTTATREAYIHFKSEGISLPVKIKQKLMKYAATATTTNSANCYIVPPGTSLTFPVTQAYKGDILLNSGYSSTFTVAKQWDDNSVLNTQTVSGSGTNAKITVRANYNCGNALIVLRNTSGAVVWSYHIWVTTYNPNIDGNWTPNVGSTNPYCTFMDRNLGAIANDLSEDAHGLFYQWGRKDPFPKTDISGFSIGPGDVSIKTSIENPGTFYYNSSSPSDWFRGWGSADRWVESEKTIYDPCPFGWRIPIWPENGDFPWAYLIESPSFTPSNSGLSWGECANWPATLQRSSSYGTVGMGSAMGFCWTASDHYYEDSSGWWGKAMQFGQGYISFTGPGKATGYPTRCVLE